MHSDFESELSRLDLELEKILAEYGTKRNKGTDQPSPGDYIISSEYSGRLAAVTALPGPELIVPQPPSPPAPPVRSMWRRLLPRALDVLIAVVMIAATLMFLQNKDPQKSLLGYRFYFIESGSMEPELPVRSFILVKMIDDLSEIHVGDNVAFYFQNNLSAVPEFWTHKVTQIVHGNDGTKFQTWGVANTAPDPFELDAENIVGKVVYCNKYIGPLLMLASKNPLPILAVIGAFFIFIHVIGRYRRAGKGTKKRRIYPVGVGI